MTKDLELLTLPGMEGHLNELEEAQLKSEMARKIFESQEGVQPWMDDYWSLLGEGYTWRQAVYMLWASQPAHLRQPKNQGDLATQVLGLTSDRAIREWRSKNPAIDVRVQKLATSVLAKRRVEVLNVLADMAAKDDYKAHNDRRMYLEMIGDYVPRQATVNINRNLGQDDFAAMSTEDLRDIVEAEYEVAQ